ncbi:MAG: PEP-CTERM sorting domain-containing protein [Phycisphaerae bacterium]|jgi:hypothetical protein
MKQILIINLVLGLCAVTAQAAPRPIMPGPLNISLEKVGTYTVTGDTGTANVDVYDIIMSSPNFNTFQTTVDLTIGAATGQGSDPFQAAYTTKTKYGGKWTYPVNLTPTEDDDGYWDPNDGSNIYQADSRFLPSNADANDPCGGIENWLAIQTPTETNDGSIEPNTAVSYASVLGKGSMEVIAVIPAPMRSPSLQLLVARIGVVAGDTVWGLDQSAWYDGVADQSDRELFLIPEPATLAFLGPGAVTLLTRRRHGR